MITSTLTIRKIREISLKKLRRRKVVEEKMLLLGDLSRLLDKRLTMIK